MKLIDLLKRFWALLPEWAKAIVGAFGAALAYLIGQGVIDLSLNPLDVISAFIDGLAAFTTGEWLALVGVFLGIGGATWWIPNANYVHKSDAYPETYWQGYNDALQVEDTPE